MVVQKRLVDLGFDPGPADGDVGSKTRTAIRSFQRRVGTPVTGEVSKSLLDRLGRELTQVASRPPQTATKPTPTKTLKATPTEPLVPDLDFGLYHALVIGNIDYWSLPMLETAVNDAEAIERLLRDYYGFSVTLLKDATRTQLINALEGLRRQLTKTDNLLIYYAGHGELDQEADRGYWLPVDATVTCPP